MKNIIVLMMVMMVGANVCWGLGDNNTVVLANNVGFAWNDNYHQTSSNKISTGIFTETPEISINLVAQNTFFGFRYRPTLLWFTSDEVERRQTVQHELNANLNHTFSQRLTLMLNEVFRRGVQPEILDRNNALASPDASFIENTVNGVAGIQLRSSTRLDISGRYYVMHYDEEAVSTNSSYNIATVGLSLRQEVSKTTTLSGSLNYDNTSYRQLNARSSSTVSIGAGVEHSFGPHLLGSLSGGYQIKDFEAAISGQNSPYGNLSFTYIFDPRLRLTAGAAYSLWEADISPYASQERLTGYFAVGYDVTPRIQVNLTGGLTRGKYLADQVYNGSVTALGGTDNLYQAAIRVAYQINRNNWVDVTYSHNKGVSDVRDDFDVNAYNVGWRLSY